VASQAGAGLGLRPEEKAAIERFEREVIAPSMDGLVILQFTASWCGPCKQLSPLLQKVAADYADRGVRLVPVDIDEQRLIAAQFRIQSVPTVYSFYQGQPVADITQYRSEGQLKRVIEQLLAQLPPSGAAAAREAEVAPLLAMGEEVLAAGDAARAANILSQVREIDPDNPEVAGALARALLAAGDAAGAEAAIEGQDAAHPAVSRARAALSLAAAPVADVSAEAARLAADPDDHEARFALAESAIASGDRDAGAEALLALIARDRDWNEGVARARFLQLLEAQGLADPWSREQRRRLSSILFT
jgi:putative thioredoxin